MKWSDIQLNPSRRTLRQFAGIWLVLLLGLSFLKGFSHHYYELGFTLAGLGLLVGLAGLINPRVIRWFFVGCVALAFPAGWVVSQMALAIIFYGVFTPLALYFRLQGRDLLGRSPKSGENTYWKSKKVPDDIRRYFRQY